MDEIEHKILNVAIHELRLELKSIIKIHSTISKKSIERSLFDCSSIKWANIKPLIRLCTFCMTCNTNSCIFINKYFHSPSKTE